MKTVRSVLIFSQGELIGDGMMKMPFIQALPQAFPEAQITWVSGRDPTIFKTALAPFVEPYLHEVVEAPHFLGKWTEFLTSPCVLAGSPFFDVIIDTEKKLPATLMLRRIPHRLFISATFHWMLSERKPPLPYKKPLHLLDRLVDLAQIAVQNPVYPIFEIEIPSFWRELARKILFQNNKRKKILLAPGAGRRIKCWPLSNFIDLAKRLKSQEIEAAFILGPAETEWKQEIQAHIPDALFPLQQTEYSSPYLTMALGELACANVANDSGVGHILAAANQPMISLWGPTDPVKSAPYGKKVTIVKAQDFGNTIMSTIPVDFIFQCVKKAILLSDEFS